MTFIANHANAVVACDFLPAVTARFELLTVFVAMEIGSRRILRLNVTPNPTAAWTLQQFRETLPVPHAYRFVLHDRDAIFSKGFDESLGAMGVEVLRTPPRSPQANTFCERLIGTVRRECLYPMIPLDRGHLYRVLRERVELRRAMTDLTAGKGSPHRSGRRS
jgi:transposase InsO family protein